MKISHPSQEIFVILANLLRNSTIIHVNQHKLFREHRFMENNNNLHILDSPRKGNIGQIKYSCQF